jgi:hypothetical protein
MSQKLSGPLSSARLSSSADEMVLSTSPSSFKICPDSKKITPSPSITELSKQFLHTSVSEERVDSLSRKRGLSDPMMIKRKLSKSLKSVNVKASILLREEEANRAAPVFNRSLQDTRLHKRLSKSFGDMVRKL